MKGLLKIIFLLLLPVLMQAQHPVTFFTKTEAVSVKASLLKYPLLKSSYTDLKKDVDQWIGKDVDVPFPKDPAGGYTHDKHKANYTLMFNSGVLYNLTGDVKYAKLVKDMMLKYAALNPTLKNHPEATSSSPGRIFWQALNDANWMVYTGMAYDLIYNSLTSAERKKIEDGAFKPEVDFFTQDLKDWFNLIHNHAVWATAGVGMIGIATNNQDYIDMALYGTEKDGKRGFIALMDNLFSSDGYYTEGPYYTRYAILPYAVFANALNNWKPSLKIFQHRNSILQKALLTCLQQTNIDGTFFPFNDALKEKDFTSNELVVAINTFWKAYGADKNLLPVAKKQNRVMLSSGGVAIAAELATNKNIPAYYNYKTFESTDGVKGDEGGISVFRNGKGQDLTSLLYKYTAHGLSHGHYDKLGIMLYDKGNEILTNYGSVRFIGVEQKYGGRYLAENKAYAGQTIAHNTIVVDETSHFNGKESIAENFHSDKLFSSISNPTVQVVAAKEDNAYKNTHMQRTLYMLELPENKKMIVDLFNVESDKEHQYDLPFQYNGHLINTSFKYKANTDKQETLGNKNGYQYIWNEAEAKVENTTAQMTFLNDRSYYSISSLIDGSAKIFLTRTGANDPDFNLRHEPAMIIRKNGKNQSFINVIEIHGNFDPVYEFSSNAYPSVKEIKLLQQDENYTVAEVSLGDKKLIIAQCNKNFDTKQVHSAGTLNWTGPFVVIYDGKIL
ncbi:MAG: alginate lyase family protein [Chitinophagaceae bacterium]|nr:alginate lyase family protein [Chitinophagaceae bacterium]